MHRPVGGANGGSLPVTDGAGSPTTIPANANFRFCVWHWPLPGRIGSPSVSTGLLAAEHCRFYLFTAISIAAEGQAPRFP